MTKNVKLPNRYVYPAIFTYDPKQEISIWFPDLDCATSGVNDADAFHSAQECLGSRLALMEELGGDIPVPSKLSDIHVAENENALLVEVYMPAIRMANLNKAVNKTVTLPAWLNAAAMERGINFSQVLQDALKSML